MNLTVRIIKNTFSLCWDELLPVIISNFLTALIVGGAMGLILNAMNGFIILLIPGVILLLLAPPALFGLFGLMNLVSKGYAVKLTTYFSQAKSNLKAAYIWGSLNLIILLIILTNIQFYLSLGVKWGIYLAVFFLGIGFIWLCMQLLALSFYPRLVEPGFKLAQKNALALMGMYPGLIMAMMILSAIFLVLGIVIPLAGLVITISLVALLINVTVEEILRSEQREAEEEGM